MPAEFEPQQAVWFGWPKFQWYTDSAMDTRAPIASIISTLSDHSMESQIMCTDADGEKAARDWLTAAGHPITSWMKFVHVNQVDIWVRDFGPIFVRNDENALAMVSFQQNQWGYSTTNDPDSKAMAAVPGLVADYLGIKTNFPIEAVSEGGDRIVNGKGVLLVDRAVEFQRNPQLSQDQLEAAFTQALGVTKIIWLNNGVREDLHADWGPIPYQDSSGNSILLYGPQTTGGHLDEFVRFADPSTIVLAQITEEEAAKDPISAVNYARLADAYRILSAATDQDGQPFKITRIPVPDIDYQQIKPDQRMYQYLASLKYPSNVPEFPGGQPIYVVKSSSYANYLVSDNVIVAPKYDNEAKNDATAHALEAAYPNRSVVQIDPSAINYAGGGIHCSTQQQPTGTT